MCPAILRFPHLLGSKQGARPDGHFWKFPNHRTQGLRCLCGTEGDFNLEKTRLPQSLRDMQGGFNVWEPWQNWQEGRNQDRAETPDGLGSEGVGRDRAHPAILKARA
jgi:hypothetical protein